MLKKDASSRKKVGPSHEENVDLQLLGIVVVTPVVNREDGPPGFPPLFPELSKGDLKMAMQYISHSDATKRLARIQRVKQGIENNKAESSVRLTRLTSNIDKGKGHVFNYQEPDVAPKTFR